MEHVSQGTFTLPARTDGARNDGSSNTYPLAVITLLFFMWGLLTYTNDKA